MKKAALKKISAIATRMEDHRVEIEALRDEEDTRLAELPEDAQAGEDGENAQANLKALDEVLASLEDIVDALEGIAAG